ncbi:unnamed protein product, partial [Oikopleura dioica]
YDRARSMTDLSGIGATVKDIKFCVVIVLVVITVE